MALTSTLYRVKLELSDIDRGVYESLDARIAQHPSEDAARLVTRILAYALLYEERLEFGRGLSEAEEPALWLHDLTGRLAHWIDVGAPSAERIHGASKRATRVSIVCHKGKEALGREMSKRSIYGAENITVLHLEPSFVAELAEALERNCAWTVVLMDGQLSVTVGDRTLCGGVDRGTLANSA